MDCFYLSVIVDNAAVNTGVHTSDTNLHIRVPAFDTFGCLPRRGTAGVLLYELEPNGLDFCCVSEDSELETEAQWGDGS